MKTALWIIAICELIKVVGGFLGGIAQAELDRRERERKKRATEEIKRFNKRLEEERKAFNERRTNEHNTERD